MSETDSASAARWFAAGRLLWGTALLAAPGRILRTASGSPATHYTTEIVRVLGLREAAQASATLAAPTSFILAAGTTVDGIHALSMMVLATKFTRYRRPALLSAALATAASATALNLYRNLDAGAHRNMGGARQPVP